MSLFCKSLSKDKFGSVTACLGGGAAKALSSFVLGGFLLSALGQSSITNSGSYAVSGTSVAISGTISGGIAIEHTGTGALSATHSGLLEAGDARTLDFYSEAGGVQLAGSGTIIQSGSNPADANAAIRIYGASQNTDSSVVLAGGLLKTADASGIWVRNTGSAAGNILIDTTGAILDVTVDDAVDNSTHGLHAQIYSEFASSDITLLTGSGTINMADGGGNDAINALNNGSGAVIVSNSLTLINKGVDSTHYGIAAFGNYDKKAADGGGTVQVTNYGDISTTGGPAIAAASYHNTDDMVSVINSGSIGSGYQGISVINTGGDILVDNSGQITTAVHAVVVASEGNATATINNTGNITTANGSALRAIGGNNIVMTNSGSLDVSGSGANAMHAAITDALASGSIVASTELAPLEGDIISRGGRGISLSNAGSGAVVVNSAANINSLAGAGMHVTALGDVYIKNTGSIGSYNAGMAVRNDGNVFIDNTGVITDSRPGGGARGAIQIDNEYLLDHSGTGNVLIDVKHSGRIESLASDAASIRIYTGALSGTVNVRLVNPDLYSETAGSVKGGALNDYSTIDVDIRTEGGKINSGDDAIAYTGAHGILSIQNEGTEITTQDGGAYHLVSGGSSGHLSITSNDAHLRVTGDTSQAAITAFSSGTHAGTAVDVNIGYDRDGNPLALTGTITMEKAGAGIRASIGDSTGGHASSGDINILLGDDLKIETGVTDASHPIGDDLAYAGMGVAAYNAGSGDVNLRVGAAELITNGDQAAALRGEKNGARGGRILIDSQATIITAGHDSHGIHAADSTSAGAESVDVLIAQDGDISVSGSFASGIYATGNASGNMHIGYRDDGGGNLVAEPITGNITTAGGGGNGIYVSLYDKDVNIETNASIMASGEDSVGVSINTGGSIYINNAGNITGETAMSVAAATSGTIINSGTLKGTRQDATAYALDLSADTITVMLKQGSDVIGNVHSRGAGNSLILEGTGTAAEATNFTRETDGSGFTGMTVQTNGVDDTRWTMSGTGGWQLSGVDAIAINDGANNTTSTLAIRPADAADYTFDHALTGDGTLEIALRDSDNFINFDADAGAGSAFTGTVALGESGFVLGGAAGSQGQVNMDTLANSTLRLDAGNRTAVEGAGAIGGLAFNTGTLVVRTSSTGGVNFVEDRLEVSGALDATGGGTIEVALSGTVYSVAPADRPASPALLDQDNYIAVAGGAAATGSTGMIDNRIVAVSGTVYAVGTQLSLAIVPSENSATLPGAVSATSALVQNGSHAADVTYDYYGAVREDGVYLSYGLARIDALETVEINNDGATDDTLGVILGGAGGFMFADTTGTTIRVGNGLSDYTGATTIASGSIVAITDNALGRTSHLIVNPHASLDLAGNTQTVHGAIEVDAGEIILGANGRLVMSATVSGTGISVVNAGVINAGGSGKLEGVIQTTGDAGHAVYASDAGSLIHANGLTVATQGGAAHGFHSTNGAHLDLENVSVTTSGAGASGVFAETGGRVELSGGIINARGLGGASYHVVSGGVIESADTQAAGAYGILLRGAAAPSANDASTVNLTGGSLDATGHLIYANGGAAAVVLDSVTASNAGNVLKADNNSAVDFTAKNTSLTGDIIADASSRVHVRLKENSVLTGFIDPVDLSIDSTSVWNMTASSELGHLTLDAGSKIDFMSAGGAYKVLAVRGDSSGAGALVMHANLAALQGDLLTVDGHFSGTYTLDLANEGGDATTGGGSLLIVQAGAPASVQLTGEQYRDSGLYRFHLENGLADPTNWYLANHDDDPFSGLGKAIVNSASLGAVNWFYELDSLHKRMGELRHEITPKTDLGQHNKRDTLGNVWVRSYASRLNANPGLADLGFTQHHYGLTAGIDRGLRSGTFTLLAGGFLNMGKVSRDFDVSSDGETRTLGGGLYATWLHDAGWFSDFVLRGDLNKNKFDSGSPIDSAAPHAVKGDYKTATEGFSIEFGRRLKRTDGWWVEPGVQAAFVWLNGYDYTTESVDAASRIKVRVNSARAAQYRGQVRFGRQLGESRWHPYGKFAAVRVDTTGGQINVLDSQIDLPYDGWRVEAGVGVNYRINSTSQLYFDYEYAKASKYERPWSLNLGYRKRW